MTTRSNFYKNPSYAYNKAFNLNSAIQNLQGFNSYSTFRFLNYLQFDSFFSLFQLIMQSPVTVRLRWRRIPSKKKPATGNADGNGNLRCSRTMKWKLLICLCLIRIILKKGGDFSFNFKLASRFYCSLQ